MFSCVKLIPRLSRCTLGVDLIAANTINPSIDFYDIRQRGNNMTLPCIYITYLSNATILQAIGAQDTYSMCSDSAGKPPEATGDCISFTIVNLGAGNVAAARPFLSELSGVVKSGITTLM
jgi:hypothetical protein